MFLSKGLFAAVLLSGAALTVPAFADCGKTGHSACDCTKQGHKCGCGASEKNPACKGQGENTDMTSPEMVSVNIVSVTPYVSAVSGQQGLERRAMLGMNQIHTGRSVTASPQVETGKISIVYTMPDGVGSSQQPGKVCQFQGGAAKAANMNGALVVMPNGFCQN